MERELVFLGSSVTFGSAAGGYSMCEYVEETIKCVVSKWAVSGTTLVNNNESSYVSRLNKHIDSKEHCDIFICQLSTNDATHNSPIGEVSSSKNIELFDVNTVAGAIEYIVARVKNKWDCHIAFYTGTYYESERYQEMVKLLHKLKEKWNFEIIDLYNDLQMRNVNTDDYKRYMNDPIHPTKIGYIEWWGPKFVDYISKTVYNI